MNVDPKYASRVVRTVHQAIVTVLVAFWPVVALLNVPAEKTAAISGGIVVVLGAVSKAYQRLFPAEPALEEWSPDL